MFILLIFVIRDPLRIFPFVNRARDPLYDPLPWCLRVDLGLTEKKQQQGATEY